MIRRWISRAACAMLFGVALPASLTAQDAVPLPPGTAPQVPAPAAPMPPVVVTAPQALAPVPAAVAAPVMAIDPYRAATPYNPTVVGRPVPSPQYNRPNFTLPCDNPNQNFAPLELTPRGCGRGGCGRTGCGGGSLFGWLKGNGDGCCTHPGSCATCCNSANFAFASSRSFFGESSREFFERPPAVDGIKHHAKKYAPSNGTVPVGGYIVP